MSPDDAVNHTAGGRKYTSVDFVPIQHPLAIAFFDDHSHYPLQPCALDPEKEEIELASVLAAVNVKQDMNTNDNPYSYSIDLWSTILLILILIWTGITETWSLTTFLLAVQSTVQDFASLTVLQMALMDALWPAETSTIKTPDQLSGQVHRLSPPSADHIQASDPVRILSHFSYYTAALDDIRRRLVDWIENVYCWDQMNCNWEFHGPHLSILIFTLPHVWIGIAGIILGYAMLYQVTSSIHIATLTTMFATLIPCLALHFLSFYSAKLFLLGLVFLGLGYVCLLLVLDFNQSTLAMAVFACIPFVALSNMWSVLLLFVVFGCILFYFITTAWMCLSWLLHPLLRLSWLHFKLTGFIWIMRAKFVMRAWSIPCLTWVQDWLMDVCRQHPLVLIVAPCILPECIHLTCVLKSLITDSLIFSWLTHTAVMITQLDIDLLTMSAITAVVLVTTSTTLIPNFCIEMVQCVFFLDRDALISINILILSLSHTHTHT